MPSQASRSIRFDRNEREAQIADAADQAVEGSLIRQDASSGKASAGGRG